LNEHLSTDIRDVCSRDALRAFPFRSRLLLAGQGKRQLHTLSRDLMELALSRADLPDTERIDAAYLDLVEFLLLYASICVEIIAIRRTLPSAQALQCLMSSPAFTQNRVKVRACGDNEDIAVVDLSALVIQESKEEADEVIRGLSLHQLAIQCLFACEIGFHGDSVILKKPKGMHDDVFRSFIHACLARIPSVETAVEREIQEVFLALRSNEDLPRLDGLEQIRNDIGVLTHDLKQVRRAFRLSRHHGCADGTQFPPYIRCKSLFRRTRSVGEEALPGSGLTNSFPSSRYGCSWDLRGTSVVNVMIPSEGVNSLMVDLKKGKFFGFKFSSIYSGKMMIIWDGFALTASGLLFVIFELLKGSATAPGVVKGLFNVFTHVLGPILWILLVKVVIYDLGHWVPWHRQFVKFMRKAFSETKDSQGS